MKETEGGRKEERKEGRRKHASGKGMGWEMSRGNGSQELGVNTLKIHGINDTNC